MRLLVNLKPHLKPQIASVIKFLIPCQASDEALLWASKELGVGTAAWPGSGGSVHHRGLLLCFVLRSKPTSLVLLHAVFISLPDSHRGPARWSFPAVPCTVACILDYSRII